MPRKIDISQMTTEEIVVYAEKVKQQNRDRVTKYYKNTSVLKSRRPVFVIQIMI